VQSNISASNAPAQVELTRLEALISDPLIQYLQARPTVWPRRQMQLLARAIVSALHDEGPDALDWGYFLLVSCVVRPGTSLGNSVCRAVYEEAVKQLREAVERQDHRRLAEFSPGYQVFKYHGVPEEVCGAAGALDLGPEQRARRLTTVSVPAVGKEGEAVMLARARSRLAKQCLFDAAANRWFIIDKGNWGPPLVTEAFKTILTQRGFEGKAQNPIIKKARHFKRTELHLESTNELLTINGELVRNTFKATGIEPFPGTFRDIWKVLRNVCNDDDGFLWYFVDWLSFVLQALYPQLSCRPELAKRAPRAVQTQVAIVLVGVHGSGKDTLSKTLSLLIGEAHSVVIDQTALDSKFHGQLRDKFFVFCNEVMSSTNRSGEAANFLKALVAGDRLAIEEKFKTAETVRSVANVIVASNDSTPVIIEEGDRRYAVKRSTQRLDAKVAERVHADLDGGRVQLAAFFFFLLNRECSFEPGRVLETPERKDIRLSTLASEKKFVAQILEDGWLSVSASWVQDRQGFEVREVVTEKGDIPVSVLNKVYAHWCKEHGIKPRGETKLGQAMKTTPGVTQASPRIGDIKTRVYRGKVLFDKPLQVVPEATPKAAHPTAPEADPFDTKGAA
jgi:hypothetical protein